MLNTFRIVVALVPIASTLPPVLSSSLLVLMNRPPVLVASMMPELVIGSGTLMVSAFAEFALMVPPLTRINGVEPSPKLPAPTMVLSRLVSVVVVPTLKKLLPLDDSAILPPPESTTCPPTGSSSKVPPAPPPTPWRLMVPLLLTTGA
jgi:hypothetical protein